MSLAEQTRQAVDRDPILYAALQRGLANYTAAARTLQVTGSETAIVDALRRYAEALDATGGEAPRIRLFGSVAAADQITAAGLDPETVGADEAVITLSGLSWPQFAVGLYGLAIAGIEVRTVHATTSTAAVIVPQTAGADAVRVLEATTDRGVSP